MNTTKEELNDEWLIIDEKKVKTIRQKLYLREICNQREIRPRKNSEMVEIATRIVKEEVDKCF